MGIKEAVKKIKKEKFILLGYVPEVLEKENVLEKKDVEEVLMKIPFKFNEEQRKFIFEQTELIKKRKSKLKKVI